MGGITAEAALALVLAHTPVIQEKERLPVAEISGRVLAEEAKTRFDNPPFPRSPIDGYACRAAGFGGSLQGAACLSEGSAGD